MLFDNYRMAKRLSKHLLKGSLFFSAPVIVAGVCGVVGLAALIYLKRRFDANQGIRFGGFDDVKSSCRCKAGTGKGKPVKHKKSFKEEDFIVIDADESDVRDVEAKSAKEAKRTKEPDAKPADAKVQPDIADKNKEASDIWIASVTSKTFHRPGCSMVGRISEKNRTELNGSRASLIRKGYKPCASCIGK